MTEILFGTPNSKTKGSLGLLLKISTENPVIYLNSKYPWKYNKGSLLKDLQNCKNKLLVYTATNMWQRDSNVHRQLNHFHDIDQPVNIWFELIHVTSI